jgi:hypothetical protein
VLISSGEVLRGQLPRRADALVHEWWKLHREELAENWACAERNEPLAGIDPLP